MKYIQSHKTSLIITIVIIILVLLAGFAIYRMFYPNTSDSIYGDRLEESPSVDGAVIEKIKEDLTKSSVVDSVTYKTNVRTMKFFVAIKNDSKLEEVNKLTDIIKNYLSTPILAYYDVSVYFTNDTMENYPRIAYLAKGTDTFIYTDNKTEVAS